MANANVFPWHLVFSRFVTYTHTHKLFQIFSFQCADIMKGEYCNNDSEDYDFMETKGKKSIRRN